MESRFLFRLTALAVAMAMVVLGAGVALADTVEADVVEATSGNQTSRDLGTVQPGQALSPTVSFTLVCKGNKHPESGQTVTLSRSSATLDGSAVNSSVVDATSATIGAIPATWPADANGPDNCGSTTPLADNGNSTVTFSAPSTSGQHTVVVTYARTLSPQQADDGSDINSNAPSVTLTFTVAAPSDTTAPETTITGGPANPTNSTSASFTFTSSETNSTFECKLDSADWTACNTGSIMYAGPLGQGGHTFLVRAKDAANNQDASPASHTWTVDTTAPTGSVSINNGDAYTNSAAATLTLSADSDTTHYQKGQGADCSTVTFSEWTSYATSVSHNLGSEDGIKNVCVKFKDAAGNVSLAASDAITVDTTKPTIRATATQTAGAGTPTAYTADTWTNAERVDVTYTCADTTDGSGLASTYSDSDSVTTEGSSTQSSSAVCTDRAGNVADDKTFGVKIDRTKPTISASATKTTGADAPTTYTENSWTNAQRVDVTYTCADTTDGSGLASTYSDSDSETSEGTTTETSDNACTDRAGNSATAASFVVKIDRTAPSIAATATKTKGSDTGPYSENTWTNADRVDVTYTCADNTDGSGLASTYSDSDSEASEGTTTETSDNACTDRAGNSAMAVSFVVKIDRTAPVNLAFVGGPAAGGSYYFGDVPAAPTCTAEDVLSGLTAAGCTVSGHSSAVGTQTMTASATDIAGNLGTLTRSYTVNAWTLKGFYNPVDMGITNTVKAGSTVPLKFEIFAGATELTSTSAVDTFTVERMACGSLSGVVDDIENYSTGGTSLRYDSTAGQFIQNWKVPTGSNICYKVVLTTDDASTATAYFKTK